MPRKVFEPFEAVSAVIPNQGSYQAAIAVKALDGGAPRFHAVLPGQTFNKAHEADEAATGELERLTGIDEEGELLF